MKSYTEVQYIKQIKMEPMKLKRMNSVDSYLLFSKLQAPYGTYRSLV